MEIVHYQNLQRNSLTKFIDSRLEKSVLENATSLITISSDIINLFHSKVENKKIN